MNGDDKELCDCMDGFAKAFKAGNPPIKGPLRTIVGLLVPVLVASADPRVKALGLALQAASSAFLQPKRLKANGGK